MYAKWIAIPLLSLVLMACAQATPAPELVDRPAFDALDGTSWTLTHCGDKELLARTVISINFENYQLSGNTGCNSYEADYDVRGQDLKVRTVMQTAMACVEPDGLMEQEAEYLKVLQGVTAFEMQEGQLILLNQENIRLVFVPADN